MSEVGDVAVGLTEAEAEARRRGGEANTGVEGSTRSYAAILRTNVFSFSTRSCSSSASPCWRWAATATRSSASGSGWSTRSSARRRRSAPSASSTACSCSTGHRCSSCATGGRWRWRRTRSCAETSCGSGRATRFVVDGPVLTGRVEADESLLTGESDPVVKDPGDDLRSGSLCVAGEARQLARDLGAASYAGRLTTQARRTSTDSTPLQRRIAFVVRLVIALTVLMSGAILAQAALEGFTLLRVVQITAVLSGLVPYGLFLLIAVAYTAGAARVARCGALAQQVNAVESISNVDVVCTDKTGTLTTGRLTLTEVEPVGRDVAPEAALGAFAASVTTPNLTTAALAEALPAEPWTVRDEVPFASSRRWSGLVTDEGVWVLGASDALVPHLTAPLAAAEAAGASRPPGAAPAGAGRGRRARRRAAPRGHRSDRLLPGRRRRAEGALRRRPAHRRRARHAGRARRGRAAGAALAGLDDPALDRLVARTTVFGRVAPEHKERIVASLRRRGRYVAMIGDGVNDARALKAAHVGVAMRSGSAVTRDVADIVLVDDSFAALPPVQREGRRIVNGIATSMYVFLARVAAQGVVIMAVTMLGLGFPYSPTQVGLTLLTVGVPTLFLTLWARPLPPDPNLLGNLARFVLPAAVVTAGFGTAVYAFLYETVTQFLSSGRTPAQVVSDFESYTGLTYTDADFTEAAATTRRVRRSAVHPGSVELLRVDAAGARRLHHRPARTGAVVRRTQRRLPVPAPGPGARSRRAPGATSAG